MRKNQIRVGGIYNARIGSFGVREDVVVRVDEINTYANGSVTHYKVTEVATGKDLSAAFPNARNFISEHNSSPASDSAPPQESSDEAVAAAVEAHDKFFTELERQSEDEQGSDPTGDEATVSVAAGGTIPSQGAEPAQSSVDSQPQQPMKDIGAPSVVETPTDLTSAPTTVPSLSITNLAARLGQIHTRAPGTPVAGMVPNQEQEAILSLAEEMQRTGQPVMVVSAGAGTGKTATLKMLEEVLRGRGQYTAFNKSLVEDSRPKFKKARVSTTHALAFGAVGKSYAHRLSGERMRSGHVAKLLGIDPLVVQMAGELDDQGLPRTKTLSTEMLAGQVLVAVKRFCQSADPVISRKHLKWIDGIDPVVDGKVGRENQEIVREYLEPYLQKAWDDICDLEGRLPFNHDCYVKMWQLGQGVDRPVIAADYIELDEAQDTAPVFLDIIDRQEHALRIMVGDENQQIYEWRGAVNAMSAFQGAPRRLLSQSYRFGQVIADVANSILRELQVPTDLVMKGLPGMPSRVAELDQADCYLYRTNAGAVGRIMTAIAAGLRPHLVGGGKDVVSWCQAAVDLQAGRKTSHPDLACFDSWGEVEEYSKTDEGQEIRLMVKLIKEFGAEEIRDALKGMPEEKDADMIACTAHKSKGREWDTVKLGADFPPANKMTDPDVRLLYVAATRAKLVLDISACPPFCGARGMPGEGPLGQLGEGGWIPSIEVEYTVPMPSAKDQEEWVRHRGERSNINAMVSAGVGQHTVVASVLKEEARHSAATATTQGKFTWTKYDDKWCARGPAGRTVGSAIVVESRDGRQQDAVIREVVKQYPDAWIYRI